MSSHAGVTGQNLPPEIFSWGENILRIIKLSPQSEFPFPRFFNAVHEYTILSLVPRPQPTSGDETQSHHTAMHVGLAAKYGR